VGRSRIFARSFRTSEREGGESGSWRGKVPRQIPVRDAGPKRATGANVSRPIAPEARARAAVRPRAPSRARQTWNCASVTPRWRQNARIDIPLPAASATSRRQRSLLPSSTLRPAMSD